jgi:hypothetical protein
MVPKNCPREPAIVYYFLTGPVNQLNSKVSCPILFRINQEIIFFGYKKVSFRCLFVIL